MIDSLLAPVRLPRRAIESLDLLGDAARRLIALEGAVLGHLESLEEQARSIGKDLAATREQVESLHADVTGRLAALDAAIPRLEHEVATTREAVDGLKAELKDVTEHLPDPDGPGPVARARQAITGGE